MNNQPSFFVPAKYKMALPDDAPHVDGGVIFPAGIMAPTLTRRSIDKDYPHLSKRLLDPQLYLSALPPSSCRKACANLATYGWFSVEEVQPFESGKHDQRTWKKRLVAKIDDGWKGDVPKTSAEIESFASKCIATQRELGCCAIITPTPLTVDFASTYSLELTWADISLTAARHLAPTHKRMVSIALSDTALRPIDPYSNDLLTVIIDQICAREPEGAYLVIEQSNEVGYYCAHPHTVGAMLRLVHGLREGGVREVVVAPFGMAGLLAVAAGATTWTANWYRGERRIRLADYEDLEGRAYPTFYSHSLASEIHLEADLDAIVAADLLKLVEDRTPASTELLRALSLGQKVNSVAEWQYRGSNVRAAIEHILQVAVRETQKLATYSPEDRINYIHQWLRSAKRNAAEVSKVAEFHQRTELRHQSAWLTAFERFLSHT